MQNTKMATLALISGIFSSTYVGASEEPTIAVTQSLDVYQNGLIATVYSDDKKTGTWASPKPVGVPIGEFIDNKLPQFSFSNIKQDEAAWSVFTGSHVGLEWSGYLNAEEPGNYVFVLDFMKHIEGGHYDKDAYFYANSCQLSLSLSGSQILTNGYKQEKEDQVIGGPKYQNTKMKAITLEKGYYPIKLWLHCGITSNNWDRWISNIDNAYWTLKLKRPSDRIVQAAPKGTLVWK